MTRRADRFSFGLLIAAVIAMSVVAGCAQRGSGPEPGTSLPVGQVLVAQSEFRGGFVPYSWRLIDAPKIAVYSDGLTVANAAHQLTLSQAEVTALVVALRNDLAGLGPTVDVGAQNHIADAPDTILQVLGADGQLQSVSAYALGIASNYPARLIAADKRLSDLADRAKREGTPFVADRVRLVAQPLPDGAKISDWPTTVPVPPRGENEFSARMIELEGNAANALRRELPDAVEAGQPWPIWRTTDGTLLGVAWRYLLPHE